MTDELELYTTFAMMYAARPCQLRDYRAGLRAAGGAKKFGRHTKISIETLLRHTTIANIRWILHEGAVNDAELGFDVADRHTKKQTKLTDQFYRDRARLNRRHKHGDLKLHAYQRVLEALYRRHETDVTAPSLLRSALRSALKNARAKQAKQRKKATT